MAYVQTQVTPLRAGRIKVDGVVKHDLAAVSAIKTLYVKWWASCPRERRVSRMGCGEPMANEEIAFEGTTNAGVTPLQWGQFSFVVNSPSPYYTDLGTRLIPPTAYLNLVDADGHVLTPVHLVTLGSATPINPPRLPLASQWRNL